MSMPGCCKFPFSMAKAMSSKRYAVIIAVLALGTGTVFAQPAELAPGSALPLEGYALERVMGGAVSAEALAGTAGVVFIFWSNNCQWCEGYEDRVRALHAQASAGEIAVVLVNANDPVAFPQEAPTISAEKGYPMAYVQDTGSRFAQALGAYRTPHVFVFDRARTLVYTGAIDDGPGDPDNVETAYLAEIIASLVRGEKPSIPPTRAFGCRIKFAPE